MIAILDGVEHFKCEDLTAYIEFPYTLKSKMRWSKNVLEKRESPDQIIIGSMDSNVCVILALAHLEHGVILNNQDSNPMLFGVSKRRIRALFEEITTQQDFALSQSSNPIGTHTIRKLPTIYARRNGCSKDDVDARGRWKSNKRIVDTYIDCLISFPDAKVASILCNGGPAKYTVKQEFNIDEIVILQCAGSNITTLFPRQVSLVLATALIWAAYDDEMSSIMHTNFVERIKSKIKIAIRLIKYNLNPIKKVS